MKLILKLTALLFFVGIYSARAQQSEFNDCNGNYSYYAMKGDVIVFKCDSVLLLNPKALGELKIAYANLRGLSTEIVSKTDASSILYKKLFDDKKKEYDTLFRSYQDFRASTANHLDSINQNVTKVNSTLSESKIKLDSIQTNLNKAIASIKAPIKRDFLTNLKWGAIGFGLALIVFVATK
jgi:hypothetical protein